MLDTGAYPLLVAKKISHRLGLSYRPKISKVYGVGSTSLTVFGRAHVSIDIGNDQVVEDTLDSWITM